MLSSRVETRRLDIDEAVRMVARGMELRHPPRAQQRQMPPRIQLLVDRGEAMLPFASDLDILIDDVTRVIGPDQVELLRFAGCPIRGAGPGSRNSWSDNYDVWTPPPRTCVLLATDLGIDLRGAGVSEWLRFAALVARSGCRVVALTPFDPSRWPVELTRAFQIVQWDRSTSAGRAASFVRTRPSAGFAMATTGREREAARASDTARLTMLTTFAVRVDSALLRVLRLNLLPELDAGVEADVWASPHVRFRSADGVTLAPEAANCLRERLAVEDPFGYTAAWRLTESMHRHLPAAIRLEEQVRFLHQSSAAGDRIQELLRGTIATLINERPDLAPWAESAVADMPAELRDSEEGRMLTTAARLRLPDPLLDLSDLPPGRLPDWISWVTPTDIDRVVIGVKLLEEAIELTEPPAHGAHLLALPRTRPLVVEISQRASKSPPQRVALAYGSTRIVHIESAAVLRTALGEVWGLDPRAPSELNTDPLLLRFQPVLRYDSNEQFFADSVAQFTVNPGNQLRRKASPDGDGAVIASAYPEAGEPALTLDFLGPRKYSNGTPVQDGDAIGVRGKDYREQYRRLRASHPELSDVVYGHAIEANGRLWLQYWFWYFYNDYQLSFGLGTHEGDWEMVQFRMDMDAGHPEIAVYTQHRRSEVRPWEEVETLGDRPVIYVARGSHAAFFEPGFHQTEAWYDLADGKRRMTHRPRLEILRTDEPGWTRWPGRWGSTLPRNAIESNSPTGPGAKRAWTDPDKMLDNPAPQGKHGRGAKAPEVRALRAAGRLRVEYDLTERDPRPLELIVTVNSEDEAGVPPRTHNIAVHAGGHGKVTTDIVLDPLKRYDVYTSFVAGDPPVPSQSHLDVIVPFEITEVTSKAQRTLRFISSAVARIRRDR